MERQEATTAQEETTVTVDRDHQDAWDAYMSTRWGAPECSTCEPDRERGLAICSSCGSPIDRGHAGFWERVLT